MTDHRWRELMDNPNGILTEEELATGHHWCWEWDGLLVGPSDVGGEWGDDPNRCRCGIDTKGEFHVWDEEME